MNKLNQVLIENYKKVENENIEVYTSVNNNSINSEISKKTYNISNNELDIYNIKVNIDSYSKDDTISFTIGKTITFEIYDSDENTFMYTSEDDNNYYVLIGYDTDYSWNNNEFINQKYPYAFIEEVKENNFKYKLLDESVNYPDYEYYHNINIWLVKINKEEVNITKEEIYEDISLNLL